MEASLELEDDVFFADLSRQISLLIMDDDDQHSLSHIASVNIQAFNEAIQYPARQASFVSYDHHHHNQISHKRESKGTGVFIPHPSHPRRKNNTKQARFTATSANNNKFQRPCDYYSRGLPNNNQSYYESFNLKKY